MILPKKRRKAHRFSNGDIRRVLFLFTVMRSVASIRFGVNREQGERRYDCRMRRGHRGRSGIEIGSPARKTCNAHARNAGLDWTSPCRIT